ncbi:MAG: Hint domain-containing protein [Marinosulfonomonas sp.]
MPLFNATVYSYNAFGPAPTTNVGSFYANFSNGSTVTVQSGTAFTNNTGTIEISDGVLSPSGGVDTIIDDTGDDDQVLVNSLVINGTTYGDAGDAIQAEAITYIQFSDGSNGQLVHLNLRDTPTQNQPQSGEYVFLVLRETFPGSGVYSKSTLSEGETFTVQSTSGSGAVPYDVLCFGIGTKIMTQTGPVEIQDLQKGARVITRSGTATLRAVISFKVPLSLMLRHPDQRPVRIQRGALGNNVPEADLVVSPQHRIFASSKIAERVIGTKEVLLAAKRLTVLAGVGYENMDCDMTYFHLLFDNHEIVYSEGVPTESLYLGAATLCNLEKELWESEANAAATHDLNHTDFAAVVPKGGKQKSIIRRHGKNQRPLIASDAGLWIATDAARSHLQ